MHGQLYSPFLIVSLLDPLSLARLFPAVLRVANFSTTILFVEKDDQSLLLYSLNLPRCECGD